MGKVILIWLCIVIFVVFCWVKNLIKFMDCDFEAPYKSEIVHGIGVFTVAASVVTCWFPDEEKKVEKQKE